MRLNEKIYQHRKNLGLSQEELATKLGVTRQAVSKWELGDSQPDLDMIVKLAQLFNVSTDYLLRDDTDTPQAQTHFLDRIPGVLGQLLRQFGWLAGVYLAFIGAVFFIMGLITFASFNSVMDDFGLHGATTTFNPSLPVATLIIGSILTIGGIVLAVWLKRKNKR